MTFDPKQDKTTTRQQWQDYPAGWNAWGPLLENWLAEHAAQAVLAGLEDERQELVWKEIEEELRVFETPDGFVGPCELVITGATR